MESSEVQSHFWKHLILKIGAGFTELITFILVFFAPTGSVLAAVGFAVFLDTIFGRWRARKAPKKNEIVTSKITRIGLVNKSIGYMLVVLGAFLMDKAFMNEIISFFFNVEFAVTKLAGLLFCWIEYSSMNESYRAVKGTSIGKSLRNLLRAVKVVKEDIGEIKKDSDAGQQKQ
jgi:hypothetical protein